VIAGGAEGRYPGGNSFPTAAQFETQFASYRGGDYQLIASSPWRGAGEDGLDLGALFGGSPSTPTVQPIEGEGVISGGPVGGSSCPLLSFMVGSYVVKIDPSTQFVGGTCGTLTIGTKIHGRGTVNADGSVSLSYLAILK
jgi:hypothetical protein